MKRTDAEAHDGNRYTEGNPSLGIPATILGSEEMNNIQEELVNIVLDAGIALNGAVENQVLQAIKIIMGLGGTQTDQVINNNAANVDVTALLFDKTDYKSVRVLFDIFRRDDTQDANEVGEMFIWHNTETDVWHIEAPSQGDDANVTFNITAAGQVQYTSSNYAGANYAGEIKVTEITTLAQ